MRGSEIDYILFIVSANGSKSDCFKTSSQNMLRGSFITYNSILIQCFFYAYCI